MQSSIVTHSKRRCGSGLGCDEKAQTESRCGSGLGCDEKVQTESRCGSGLGCDEKVQTESRCGSGLGCDEKAQTVVAWTRGMQGRRRLGKDMSQVGGAPVDRPRKTGHNTMSARKRKLGCHCPCELKGRSANNAIMIRIFSGEL